MRAMTLSFDRNIPIHAVACRRVRQNTKPRTFVAIDRNVGIPLESGVQLVP